MSADRDDIPDLAFHLAAHAAATAGTDALTVEVGGVAVALTGLDSPQRLALERRYGIFCRRTGTRPDLTIRVGQGQTRAFLKLRRPAELYRIDIRWEGGVLMACSYEWAGWFDQKRGAGGLTLAGIARDDPRAFDRSIENFLRVAVAHLIVARGGFLLHAAGLVRDGRAYLFFGPSGSGKTTVTALTPEALILSDDLTMVVKSPDGGYRACSVPFRGLFAPEPVTEATWPVAGFFRLVQDTSDRLVDVGGARAVGELIGSLPFVTERPEAVGQVMDAVADAASKVKVFRLHFRKDRTFWDVVHARCAGVDDFSAADGIKR